VCVRVTIFFLLPFPSPLLGDTRSNSRRSPYLAREREHYMVVGVYRGLPRLPISRITSRTWNARWIVDNSTPDPSCYSRCVIGRLKIQGVSRADDDETTSSLRLDIKTRATEFAVTLSHRGYSPVSAFFRETVYLTEAECSRWTDRPIEGMTQSLSSEPPWRAPESGDSLAILHIPG